MSKPRIRFEAAIDTEAHANTIKDSITNWIIGKDIFEIHTVDVFDLDILTVVAEFRFNNQVDRDTLKDWIKDRVSSHPQVKNWVLSAKISTHNCTHNDAVVQNCGTTNYLEWERV